MTRSAVLVTFSWFLCMACGDDKTESPGDDPDAAPGETADGGGPDGQVGADGGETRDSFISPYCGPIDQPALRISIGDDLDEQTCSPSAETESLVIVLWTDEPEPPATLTFSEREGGNAQYCPGGRAPCLSIEEGEVTFETFETETGATGTYQLNGGEYTGAFDAAWCDPFICG